MKVIVVGAGLAGLTCAKMLQKGGAEVMVLDGSDRVGGRLQTDRVEGFQLDRGFQVLFTQYPAVKRQLNMPALKLRRFDPGAIIARGTHRYVLTDPLRDPANALSAAISPVITPLDKLLTVLLALELRFQSIDRVISGRDTTTERFLRRRGFSNAYINYFIRPFYGGIFLDRSLNTSAKCFKFDLKMLSEGYAVVPSEGIAAIPEQLARPLVASHKVRLNTRVQALKKDQNGTVTGVRCADGTAFDADAVVLAVEAPEAARLSGHKMPKGRTGTVNLYWGGPSPVYRGKKLVLNANPQPFVNNAVQLSNIAPEYAPPGEHLLSATVVGVPEGDDDVLFMRGIDDLCLMFRGDRAAQDALENYRPLGIYKIPYSQFAQPPGIHPHLPDNTTSTPGLLFAAEFTEASSQNAAMISGEKAAQAILGRYGNDD